MFRAISSAIATFFSQPHVPKMLIMVRLDFDGGTLAWNSGTADISYGGKTYVGASALGQISKISESAGVKSAGVNVSLSGVETALVAALQLEPFLNRPAYIYLAVLNVDDSFDSNNVVLLFRGKMDALDGVQGANPSFSVSIRSRLSDWERVRSYKYTDADQQRMYPGDRGMEYIPQLSQRKLIWPNAAFFPDPRD